MPDFKIKALILDNIFIPNCTKNIFFVTIIYNIFETHENMRRRKVY